MAEAAVASSQRVDQWLWFARIAKSRTLAQALVSRGKVRLNRIKIDKPSMPVKPGDVLTLTLGPRVLSLEIAALGVRRGPAPEAQLLYRDLTPPPAVAPGRRGTGPEGAIDSAMGGDQGIRSDGAGRPTKRERRETDRLRGR
jgi:ribosome-associated heat shock protein Hsp15